MAKSDFFQVFSLISPGIGELPNFFTIIQNKFGLDIALFMQNCSFTILQTILLCHCLLIYVVINEVLSSKKLSSRPFLIGISGHSGVGKTSLSEIIKNIFGKNQTQLVHGDDNHRWERGHEKWSEYTHLNPKANNLYKEIYNVNQLVKGKPINRKHYNHNTGKFDDNQLIYPKNLMIFEGLHTLFLSQLNKELDLKIYVEAEESLREFWKIGRDSKKRNQNKEKSLLTRKLASVLHYN